MIAVPQTPLDRWLPKLVLCLRQYNLHFFTADVIAGLTVGLVALPLAMAFGIASGVTPQAGIYTAVVAGFLISALGGSRTQIGGPTGAFVVIVAGIVAKFGLSGLFIVTMMAGIILVVMGATGLGTAVKFIPRPGDHRVYQRHRGLDRFDADSRFSGFENGSDSERIPRPHARPVFALGIPSILTTLLVGWLFAGDHRLVAVDHETRSGVDHRAVGGNCGRHRFQSAGRHDWLEVRRNSDRASGVPIARVPGRPDSSAAALGSYGRLAGGR